jgi:hypothetical protein
VALRAAVSSRDARAHLRQRRARLLTLRSTASLLSLEPRRPPRALHPPAPLSSALCSTPFEPRPRGACVSVHKRSLCRAVAEVRSHIPFALLAPCPPRPSSPWPVPPFSLSFAVSTKKMREGERELHMRAVARDKKLLGGSPSTTRAALASSSGEQVSLAALRCVLLSGHSRSDKLV